jgi:cytochrome c oxidase subunit 2
VIPTVLVFIVFAWGFKTYLKMNIAPGNAIQVKATGQKWFWSFDYAEGINTVNELVVPVDTPIEMLLSSKDVIHSFFVPNFRVKMDVLPNRYTKLWFEATAVGEYDLFCAEYCGKGHSEMLATVRVLSDEDYAAWLEAGDNAGEGLSLEEFGAKLYTSKACNTCHSIDGSNMVGPTWQGAFDKTVNHTDGTSAVSDENYLRESILNPQARIITGYAPVMPAYQGLLKEREVDALITYIKSLK